MSTMNCKVSGNSVHRDYKANTKELSSIFAGNLNPGLLAVFTHFIDHYAIHLIPLTSGNEESKVTGQQLYSIFLWMTTNMV